MKEDCAQVIRGITTNVSIKIVQQLPRWSAMALNPAVIIYDWWPGIS